MNEQGHQSERLALGELTGRPRGAPRTQWAQAQPRVSLPSPASSSSKAPMSFSREARDSWICRPIWLSPAPTFGGRKGEGGRRKSLSSSLLALGPGGNGARALAHTHTRSASSSSCLRALEANTCWEACRSVARVWLESRLAWRRSCSPSLSKALASYDG